MGERIVELSHPDLILDETLVRLRLEALRRGSAELGGRINAEAEARERDEHAGREAGRYWADLARKLRDLGRAD